MYVTEKFTGYTTAGEDGHGDHSGQGKIPSKGKASEKKSDVRQNGNKEWKRALDYGWEYVVSGEKSDKENLESVLYKILFIRAAMNFIAIISDTAKRSEAFAMAAAIVGFTGLAFLIRFVQTIIIIVWSFVEGMTDIAALLQGRDVPVIKNSRQIMTTLPEVFIITNEAITSRAKRYGKSEGMSFGYKEYVLMFMMMTSQATRKYRIMDLIDADMRKNGYKDFTIGKCAFDMEVEAGFRFPAKFFRLPVISDILERDLSGYSFTCLVREGYL